jgi:hypothetical protein
MEMIKKVASMLWMNHKKKLLGSLVVVVLYLASLVSGVPFEELKDAAKSALGVSAPAGDVIAAPGVAPVIAPVVVPEVKK